MTSALYYYISSFFTLLTRTEFWRIPLIPFIKPLAIKIDGKYKFYVDRFMDVWVLKEVIIDKQYAFYKSLDRNGAMIDVGGGIADFDVLLSSKLDHIYAFDPDKNRYDLALRNLKENNIKNVTFIKKAVTELDSIFSTYKIKKCSILKLDCEGCEYKILLSTKNGTFKKIDKIVMESHLFTKKMRNDSVRLVKFLKENDFKVKERKNPVHDYIKFIYASK